jgi:hypothetical protein
MRNPYLPVLALALLLAAPAFAGNSGAKGGKKGAAKRAPEPPPAEPGPPPATPASDDHSPWAEGVPQEKRAAAIALFEQGNAMLKDSVFVQASARYREALEQWDHPAIHYNLVLALVNLDQPVEMHEHLEKAMRYGPDPLDVEKFKQAKSYLQLVEKQLTLLEVRCDVAGAEVAFDGKPLFVGPGKHQGWVRSGRHTLVATKEGFVPNEMAPQLQPGDIQKIDMKMYTADALVRYRQRWSSWIPWTVLATGAAVAGGGVAMHLSARDSFKRFDDGITACGGCVPEPALKQKLQSGQTLQTGAIAAYAVGAAAIATGAGLLYTNRPEPYRLSPGEVEVQSVTVVPQLSPDGAGVFAAFQF